MACNGFNHAKDCQCNFRGGHPRSRPPVWRGWKRRAVKRYLSGPNAACPECHAPVYYIPGPKGGGAYYNQLGPPWPKHACTNNPSPYSPYGRTGKPKLRNRRSEFERDAWLPFLIRHIECLASGTIIHGVALDDPTVLHFGTTEANIDPDTDRPIYFRLPKSIADEVEFNFFPKWSSEAVSRRMINDCRSDFDLLLKMSLRKQ